MDSNQDNNKETNSCCSGSTECSSSSNDKKSSCCSSSGIGCISEICNFSKLDIKWLADKVQRVMLDPKGCWDNIKAENLEPKDMYAKYLFPLALLAAICSFIGASVIGISTAFGTIRYPFFSGLIFQIATFVVSLFGYAVMAFIVEKLAPKFDAQVSFSQALMLVGFSATPGLLAGLFSLFPSGLFAFVAILLSIYSLYLLWAGFDKIISVLPEKKVAFFATTVVCSILAMVVLQLVNNVIFGPRIPSEVVDQKQFEESIKKLMPEAK